MTNLDNNGWCEQMAADSESHQRDQYRNAVCLDCKCMRKCGLAHDGYICWDCTRQRLAAAEAERDRMKVVGDMIMGAICGSTGPLAYAAVNEAFDELEQRLAKAEEIIHVHLDHSSDGVLLCTYDGPLYCPKCQEPVRQSYDICYCDSCPNPDDYGTPPLPLFYSQCSTQAATKE